MFRKAATVIALLPFFFIGVGSSGPKSTVTPTSACIHSAISRIVLPCAFSVFSAHVCNADMLTFPLPSPLKNNYVLARSAECFADAEHRIQTNPVKKLRQDNALTLRGREDAKGMAKQLSTIGFSPTFIWTSNTERAYETAVVIARELQLGQNRIIPEYSFLDARSAGIFEDRDADATWKIIHEMDEKEGVLWKPPKNSDGTPNESVTDVLVRGNQLVSTIESMHSGENVLIISPDSENLSILEAALEDANPDSSLLRHARFAFKNAEVRPLHPNVVARTTLATGQTQEEADASTRKMKAVRVKGSISSSILKEDTTWYDILGASLS